MKRRKQSRRAHLSPTARSSRFPPSATQHSLLQNVVPCSTWRFPSFYSEFPLLLAYISSRALEQGKGATRRGGEPIGRARFSACWRATEQQREVEGQEEGLVQLLVALRRREKQRATLEDEEHSEQLFETLSAVSARRWSCEWVRCGCRDLAARLHLPQSLQLPSRTSQQTPSTRVRFVDSRGFRLPSLLGRLAL